MASAPPAAVPAPSSPPLRPDEVFALLCALLRDIRAEAQNLQRSLSDIKQKASLTDPQIRAREIEAALGEACAILGRNRSQIDSRLAQIRLLFQQDPKEYDWCGDEVTEIENYWDRILASWPTDSQAAEDALRRIGVLDDYLDQIIYHCEALTIPSRLNVFLNNLRVGQPLDFHRTFDDELPKKTQRQRVLDDLARQPGVVEGVVDAPNGLIYRIAPAAWRRRISPLMVIGVGLAGFLVVWLFTGLGAWFQLDRWPAQPSQFPAFAVGYLFLTFGSLAHLGVNALKQSRAETNRSFVALEDWVLWLHVRETSIIWGIVYLWLGFLIVAWALPGTNWQTFFFAGYSIDSIVNLFLERFQKLTSTKSGEIQASLKGA